MFAQQQHKLVTAHAGHGVADRGECAQAARGFFQQAVADAVAVGVVHGLEMVQVQHADRQQQAFVAGHEDGVGQAFCQRRAVVEARQCVMPCVPGDLVAQIARFRHVAEHQHAAHGHAVAFANGRRGVFDGVAFA
ncbi:hypothetical protein D3C71_1830750 [compost metagenome]